MFQQIKVTNLIFNECGMKTQSTSPLGFTTQYFYDNKGNLEKITQINSQDATKPSISVIVYDNNGRKTKTIKPNQYNPADDNININLFNNTYNGNYGDII